MQYNYNAPAGRGGRGRGRGFSVAGQKRPAQSFMGGALKVVNENVHRFLVSNDVVRKVIGKGGQNIKQVLADTQTKDPEAKVFVVQQYSDSTPVMEGAADRVLVVQANMEGLRAALEGLTGHIQRDDMQNKKLEIRMMIPYHTVSCVIGSKGATVKRIKMETRSFIQTYTDELPNSNEVIVRMQNFEMNDLVSTVQKVAEVIGQHKGDNPIKFYEPIYFEQCQYGNTGSYVDTDYYQEAIRSGQIISPYSGKKRRTEVQGSQQWGAGAYQAQEWGADSSQWNSGYDEWGSAYQTDGGEWASNNAYGEWDSSYTYGNGYAADGSYDYGSTQQMTATNGGGFRGRGRGRGGRGRGRGF